MTSDDKGGGGSFLYDLFFKRPDRAYTPAPRRPVGTPQKADAALKYMPFEHGVDASDFDEPQRSETIERPLTSSTSRVVNGINSFYGEEMNPVRKANNAVERTMPTTEESVGAGIRQVPSNFRSGAMLLVNPVARKKLDDNVRTLMPFFSTVARDGPEAVFEDGIGAVKDGFKELLEDPIKNFKKIPPKAAKVTSLAMTPPEEQERLRENAQERLHQVKVKLGASTITGGMVSYAVKQGIVRTGMPGARMAAIIAGLSLFGIKTLGALDQAVGDVATFKQSIVDKSDGHHFDKRLQDRAKRGSADPKE